MGEEHTAGKWRIGRPKNEWSADNDRDNTTIFVVAPKRSDPVCIVVEGAAYGRDATLHANAHLIAASPALLRELRHLVRLLEPLEQSGALNVPGLATLNGARSAISRATGGEDGK